VAPDTAVHSKVTLLDVVPAQLTTGGGGNSFTSISFVTGLPKHPFSETDKVTVLVPIEFHDTL